MSDVYALARLLILSNRVALICIGLVGATLVVCSAAFATVYGGDDRADFVQATIAMICFVAGLLSLGMFSMSDRVDMRRSESGCSGWLLRMPVAAWKIAVVPIALKSVWIVLLWSAWIYTFNGLNAQHRGQVELSYSGPLFALCASSVWLMMLTWRPFRWDYWRLAFLIVSLILLYGLVIFSFIPADQGP